MILHCLIFICETFVSFNSFKMTASGTGFHFGVPNLEVISDVEVRSHFQHLLSVLEPQGYTIEIESWASPLEAFSLADHIWRPQVSIHRYWYIGFCVSLLNFIQFFYSILYIVSFQTSLRYVYL